MDKSILKAKKDAAAKKEAAENATETAKTETPKTEAPKTEAPKTEAPKKEASEKKDTVESLSAEVTEFVKENEKLSLEIKTLKTDAETAKTELETAKAENVKLTENIDTKAQELATEMAANAGTTPTQATPIDESKIQSENRKSWMKDLGLN